MAPIQRLDQPDGAWTSLQEGMDTAPCDPTGPHWGAPGLRIGMGRTPTSQHGK